MCKPASVIVTKDAILWSKTSDKHEDIIEEYGLKDNLLPPDFVRVELSPENDLLWTDTARWLFNIDQDVFPDWWNAKKAETKVRNAILKWQKTKVIRPNEISQNGKIYNYGIVKRNNRTVRRNEGTIESNYGIVKWSYGTVERNYKTVERNDGAIESNYGIVERNYYGTVGRNEGTIESNYGIVKLNNGIVVGNTDFHKPDKQGPTGIYIDRSGDVPVCYVGPWRIADRSCWG